MGKKENKMIILTFYYIKQGTIVQSPIKLNLG